jgi:hypothetical protein
MKYILAAIVAGVIGGATQIAVMQHPKFLDRTYWADLATKPLCDSHFREAADKFSQLEPLFRQIAKAKADAAGCRL